ncbi:MAG TPA: hypothetical protein VHE35_08710 [Kofleriaceae bacterium]|nr:hypothetical protein [Kofleriaceae bacterium]
MRGARRVGRVLPIAAALVAALAAAGVRSARAQSMDDDRFFIDKEDKTGDDETLWQGDLTSSSFYYSESGAPGSTVGGAVQPESASPFSRLFTDLRAQLDARHVKGGAWDARVDARVRLANDPADRELGSQDNRLQSGLFGGPEYDLKELYAVHGGRRTDVFVGRQLVADIAATKIDGVRVDYAKSRRWTLLGFAGLYPRRGSRSLDTDYPKEVDLTGMPTGGRVLPVAVGGGAAYRTSKSYGALGAGAIAVKGERPRVFVSDTGYWRQGPRLDVWHYVVVDLYGSGGFQLTNVSAGIQWKPQPRMRLELAAHRVDTEALSLQIRDQLENVDSGGFVVNNLKAERIESDSLRASLSASLGRRNRFDLTAGLAARRRPAVALTPTVSLDATQSIDVTVEGVDRHSIGGLRLDLAVTRSVGVGEAAYARSNVLTARLDASRSWHDDRLELQGEAAYLSSRDDNAGQPCDPGEPETCYGSAKTSTVQLSAVVYWRLAASWFTDASVGYDHQAITLMQGPQPAIGSTTGFLRLGYRF